MDLKEMKVRDVLQLEEFKRQLEFLMKVEVNNQRKAEQEAANLFTRICRTPLDRLREKGVWEIDKMIDLFANVLNKSLVGFSNNERQYIYLLGMASFKRTMMKLQEIEELNAEYEALEKEQKEEYIKERKCNIDIHTK